MNIHHIALICSDYQKSKKFYTQVLGLKVLHETYREDRQSYKLDLGIDNQYVIELFSFPNPPKRLSYPECCGLRHLAFGVEAIEEKREALIKQKIKCETMRIDEHTQKKFFFISDPDDLPIEFYQL